MCQAVIYHLYNIKCNSKYLSYDDRKSIGEAVIMSCINNIVIASATQLSKLQHLQK